MRWSSLLLTLRKKASCGDSPHAIIFQLGESDLPEEKGVVLSRTIITDLLLLHNMLPRTMLFWSGLLEWKFWKGALAPEKVDVERRRACKALSLFVMSFGGGGSI